MASTILVVENDKDFRKTVCDYLIIAGYKVFEAQVVTEAEEILKSRKFSAAIVDVRMKDDDSNFDWSGLVLARTIEGQSVPVIILTVHDSPEDVELADTVAPGMKPSSAFISKNDPHFLERISEKLEDLSISPKANTWLKRNWEKFADVIMGVFKNKFKFG